GLEGQEAAVAAYAKSNNFILLRSYTEVETGKRSDRPELARALADCKLSRATLVIGKLDRLSRNVHFLSGLMESGVDFIACDNPHANRLTLHILAAVAEDEARRISERTRAALAAYKARGGVLGAARPGARRLGGGANPAAARRAGEVSAARARDAYAHLAPLVARWRAEGLSHRRIAARLDAAGYATRSGKPWNHTQVGRVLKYAAY
ncbi:MAG: recombinase family protein, partial [Planctomycetaceae bacterium]|nr:recombinase family protein [Planctomycetaceae bacterium]